ncbi:Late embryogenesis abundant protein, partial [Musa troglodytarum]
PPRRAHRLACPPPHEAQVLPPGRLRRPVQPLLRRWHPHRRPPGHPRLPQPQRPHRRLLRPRRRLRPLQGPAGHRHHRPPTRLPGPQRRHRLDQNAGYILLYVRVVGSLRWKVGTWISGHYHLQVNCPVFLTVDSGRSHGGDPSTPYLRFQHMTACSVDV